jgi:Na+/melibiose symporter-like transporter
MVVVWERVAKFSDKRTIFLLGAPLSILALIALLTLQPGNVRMMYLLGMFAGMGVATLYMVPFSMLPDVVDLDELETGLRREGLYFSAVVFLQKVGIAIALFASGTLLDLTGFVANADNQPGLALWTIRLLIGHCPRCCCWAVCGLPIVTRLAAIGISRFCWHWPNGVRHKNRSQPLTSRKSQVNPRRLGTVEAMTLLAADPQAFQSAWWRYRR